MNREPHSTLYQRTRDGAANADASDAQVRCRRANLLGTSALCGGKLRGLAFVAGLAGAVGVFGASPAFAQCASGDASLTTPACQANVSGLPNNNTAVGLGAITTGGNVNNTAVGSNANAMGDGGGGNTAVGTQANASSVAGGTFNTALGFNADAHGNAAVGRPDNEASNLALGNNTNATGNASANVAIRTGGTVNSGTSGEPTVTTATTSGSAAPLWPPAIARTTSRWARRRLPLTIRSRWAEASSI